MKYELAKKMKDAGFPFNEWFLEEHSGQSSTLQWENKDWQFPTLSELIEACGSDFHCLVHNTNAGIDCEGNFWSVGRDSLVKNWVNGATPEETVANFWLEINKK